MSITQTIVDGRYLIVGRIAAGGMGEVYRATDVVLGRDVALKVLHPHLAGDPGFVERFRREARSAALLNHQNIVGVHDWGQTDGTYFMVMEFVRGHSLRAVLTECGRLAAPQVVEVSLQVLAALDHAHGHGIVHRDIKPENILVAADGTVKVADFGLARAYADSSISQAEGTVTGTVQYLAPEQIQGEPADPRTDLYAFGVVMFELLTGHPPFSGETALAIAYQHLSSRVPPPSAEVPTVPLALEQVVLSATEKQREDRPASARGLREDVARASAHLPSGRPLRELVAQLPPADVDTEERAATVTIPRAVSQRARRKRRYRLVLALAAVLVALATGAWAAWVFVVPHYTFVPRVEGMELAVAGSELREAGLQVEVAASEYSSTVPAGQVIRAEPAAGSRVRTRSVVELVPSKGPELLPVPRVVGMSEAAAKEALRARGFRWSVRDDFHETAPQGEVVDQEPGQDVRHEKGATVTITVSKGPPPIEMPNVVGESVADATEELEATGADVVVVEEFSDAVGAGLVIRTEPTAGADVFAGDRVTLYVSKGPERFEMPDVRGMSEEEAVAHLEALDLNVAVEYPDIGFPFSTGVVGQDPPAGDLVARGDTVTLYVIR